VGPLSPSVPVCMILFSNNIFTLCNILGEIHRVRTASRKHSPRDAALFNWRKKWADCWDEVKYCSERCPRHRSQLGQ
jgi:hypothetical protein